MALVPWPYTLSSSVIRYRLVPHQVSKLIHGYRETLGLRVKLLDELEIGDPDPVSAVLLFLTRVLLLVLLYGGNESSVTNFTLSL